MKKWFNEVRKKKQPQTPQPDELTLGARLKQAEMDLQSARNEISHLQSELQRLQDSILVQSESTVHIQLEEIAGEIASALAQLETQAYLLEMEHKNIQARDILQVARRFTQAFARRGVITEGVIGEVVLYDPVKHMPIRDQQTIPTGNPATIRVPAVRFRGKIITRAQVVPRDEKPS